MKVTVKRLDSDYHMEAVNDTGNSVYMDGSPAIGGNNLGARPMQLLLMGAGGCSMIDLISILRKQRVEAGHIEVDVSGDRDPDEVPSLFRKIHLEFTIHGLDETGRQKAMKAAALSMEKYCSVAKTLEQSAEITWNVNFV